MTELSSAQAVSLPPSLRDVEPVRSVRTPVRMEYTFVPGIAAQTYLKAFANKQILGNVSPDDGAVFNPPRGVDPRTGSACSEFVELGHTGHIGSFCVTRVPIPGRDDLELPYISAWIFIDGADIGYLNLVSECPPEQCRIGMRVEAVWKDDDQLGPTAENILYWRPTGGPDVPYDEATGNTWTAPSQARSNGGSNDA